MKRYLVLLPLLAAIGCGGGSDSATTYTEDDVITAAQLATQDNGTSYQTMGQCEVAVILDSEEEVSLYRDAGDTVVTNPSGNAGVKLVGADQPCIDDLTTSLKSLD